jgi:hypothetical protein
MPVPEASMHEHHGMVPGKDDVRFAGQILAVDTETKP